MKFPSPFVQRSARLGFSALLSLSLLSCTETKTKNVPGPVNPPPPTPVVNEEAKDYGQYTTLVWGDEFDGGSLDQSKWVYELGGGGWGNKELQNYTNSADNTYFSGGKLFIEARKQQSGNNAYTSARLVTKGKQSFQYGRIDVRAKLPKGKGIWPAIWMLGNDIDQNNWPKCGEIDIMELRGSQPREFLTTMHFANSAGTREYKGKTQPVDADITDDFHVFSVVRSKDMLRFYFDGAAQPYYTLTPGDTSPHSWPFNNPFFMILNVAVGGDFDGDPAANTVFPQQMQIDYVRYYQYK
ncbi:glycoside hydrolase family 16 protein [Hymenobacter chitinivorans]|uniref:Glycosyl hydrolase family 16 n=1 Tax=Hymenobacter chitinivorans DSM 11115 TaxID=1121954 RepID=A0A2M9B4V4_9BACT|nr:glycoside hydrolase family 16 protein [Hymenobacter chitinivorans]PJJ52963.1 glycosyl hydrolase family 16 [Hymenobacter chitinivorans DSM 11115]